MKTLIQLIVICLLSINAQALALTAPPVKDLMAEIATTKFKYTETGLAYGFTKIKSCIYTSPDMIVLKNYCYPKKDHLAKGYTIISKKFGLVEFYQEDINADILKRDVALNGFPEMIAPFLNANLSRQKLTTINNFLKSYNAKLDPACWSTNYSFHTNAEDVACYKTDIAKYPAWSEETQTLLSSQTDWLQLIKTLEAKFPR